VQDPSLLGEAKFEYAGAGDTVIQLDTLGPGGAATKYTTAVITQGQVLNFDPAKDFVVHILQNTGYPITIGAVAGAAIPVGEARRLAFVLDSGAATNTVRIVTGDDINGIPGWNIIDLGGQVFNVDSPQPRHLELWGTSTGVFVKSGQHRLFLRMTTPPIADVLDLTLAPGQSQFRTQAVKLPTTLSQSPQSIGFSAPNVTTLRNLIGGYMKLTASVQIFQGATVTGAYIEGWGTWVQTGVGIEGSRTSMTAANPQVAALAGDLECYIVVSTPWFYAAANTDHQLVIGFPDLPNEDYGDYEVTVLHVKGELDPHGS
jgi:hypothetical protein